MAIKLEPMEFEGVYECRIDGPASSREHAGVFGQIDSLIAQSMLEALLIDARTAEIPAQKSLSQTIWEDGMAVLSPVPVCYLPPAGGDAARRAMIETVIADWDADFTIVDDWDQAMDWCRAHARRAVS